MRSIFFWMNESGSGLNETNGLDLLPCVAGGDPDGSAVSACKLSVKPGNRPPPFLAVCLIEVSRAGFELGFAAGFSRLWFENMIVEAIKPRFLSK